MTAINSFYFLISFQLPGHPPYYGLANFPRPYFHSQTPMRTKAGDQALNSGRKEYPGLRALLKAIWDKKMKILPKKTEIWALEESR